MGRYVSKQFFTEHAHETGNIVCVVETCKMEDMYAYEVRKGGQMTASVKVSDCHDSAVIEFDSRKEGDFEKRLAKMDKWIDELQKMRQAMVDLRAEQVGQLEIRKQQLIESGDWHE